MFKRIILPLALLLVTGMFVTGCKDKGSASAGGKFLCGGCGQVKGSDVCCKEGVPKCDECKLDKGSPGCCKITKGKDAALCDKCGLIKGSELCCKADAAKCDKCGMLKGSPLCCK